MNKEFLPLRLTEAEEDTLDQFEANCKTTKESVQQFLLRLHDSQTSSTLLLELVLLEMEYRIKSGEQARAEDYFTSFPQLTEAPQLMVRLIAFEFHLKQAQLGPRIEDFIYRFPNLRLELLTAIHLRDNFFSRASNCDDGPTKASLLGKYEVLAKIGQGSFSTVYKAKDPLLGRIVAVKRLRVNERPNHDLANILNEAKNTAVLSHPNIVQLFEVTVTERQEYLLVSQFIDGTNLEERTEYSSIIADEAAQWVREIADALNYAHQLGILHLDVKPSNILIDRDQKVWLSDFGLSRCFREFELQNNEWAYQGTLAYMSPEQAGVTAYSVDSRSDVYSLGVVLFELLTGQLPFKGNRQSLIEQLASENTASLRMYSKKIHKDLEQICLKALSRDPGLRYQSAKAMADDLSQYLAGLPTQARPLGKAARVYRWSTRNPAKVSLLLMLFLACAVGAIGIIFQWQRALSQERLAERSAADLFNALSAVVQTSSETALRDPKSSDQMRTLLNVAKENYEHALKSNMEIKNNPYQTARALVGLGTVFNQIGDYEEAMDMFDEASRYCEMVKIKQQNDQLEKEIWLGKATSLRRNGNKLEASQLYRQVRKRIESGAANGVQELMESAEVAWYIAEAELSQNRYDQALETARWSFEQLTQCQSIIGSIDNSSCTTGCAKSKYLMATCHYELEHYQEAIEEFRQASEYYERLVRKFPSALNFRRDLAASYHNQARSFQQLGDLGASAELYRLAISVRQELVRESPESPSFLSDLRGSEKNLSLLQQLN